LDVAATALRELLPPLDDPVGLLPGETMSPVNHLLIRPHILLYAGSITLYNLSAHEDPKSYQRALRAALDMGALVRRIRGSSSLCMLHVPSIHIVSARIDTRLDFCFSYIPCISHLSQADFYAACEILIRELHQSYCTPGSPSFLTIEHAIEALFDGLLDLVHLYPVWGELPL
jgi:hypothetical protein